MSKSKLNVIFGELLFCFSGNISKDDLAEYFPGINVDDRSLISNQIFCIDVLGKYTGKIPKDFDYEATNFLGAKYKVFTVGEKRYLLSKENQYGDHIYIQQGHHYQVFYLGNSSGTDVKWAIRLCREIILNAYLDKGYIPLHASAVSYKNRGILAIGEKGSGKSTMLSTCVYFGGDAISNDLVLVGVDENGQFEMIGWPWKVTVGNGLALEMGFQINEQKSKMEMTPQKFCENFDCRWMWRQNIAMLVFPEIIVPKVLNIRKIDYSSAVNYIKAYGLEYESIVNIFSGMNHSFDLNNMVNRMLVNIPCFSFSGNIWEGRDRIKSFLEERMGSKVIELTNV